jgi:two-component system NtrC family sensor kinase
MKPEAKKQNTIIAFDEYESDIELYLDKIQIQQVFSNIILNAIQAITIEEGKIEIGIKFHTMHNPNIESSARKKYVLIDIKDNGSGIPDEYLKHIFEPYFSTKDEGKGTGLGLSISDDIVKEHKGWIKVKNNKDRGCCFTIYLPCNGEE